jgi:hypothetical protein
MVTPTPNGKENSVQFFNNGEWIGAAPIYEGAAVFQMTMPNSGAMSITAVFRGGLGYNSSISEPQTLVINPQNTTGIALTSVSPNPATAGQSITLTATIAPVPTGSDLGTVNFYNGATLLGTAPVVAWGASTLTVSGLTAGTMSLTAVYSGNVCFGGSTTASALSVVVNPAAVPTVVALTSISPNPPTAGQSTTFSAAVSPAPEGHTLGTVNFYNGSSLLGAASVLQSGAATLTVNNLVAGNFTVSAAYSGTVGYAPSTSSGQSVVVNPTTVATAIALTSVSPDPPAAGESTTFTATITPAPTGHSLGNVSFYNGSALLGTAGVSSSGIATLITSDLTQGSMSVTAGYSGTAGFAQSTSAAQTVVVGPAQTSTRISLIASPNPVYAGQPLTLTATISPAPAGSFPGTVNFYKGSTLLGSAAVNASGVASFTTSALPSGDDSITASYSGDSGFASATSSAISQTVNPAYGVSASQAQYSIASGGSVQITIGVPQLGGAFDGVVTMSAAGLPSGASASFNPATVTPGSSGASTVLTVNLATTSAATRKNRRNSRLPLFAFALAFCSVLLPIPARPRRRKSVLRALCIAMLLLGAIFIASCGSKSTPAATTSSGGGGSTPVESGSYALTITGTSGSLHPSTTVILVVQ